MTYNQLFATHISAGANIAASQGYDIIDRRKKAVEDLKEASENCVQEFCTCA